MALVIGGKTAKMTDDNSIASCHECERPLAVIDYYNEHPTGCITCNLWCPPGKGSRWKRLPEEDLRELHRSIRGPGE